MVYDVWWCMMLHHFTKQRLVRDDEHDLCHDQETWGKTMGRTEFCQGFCPGKAPPSISVEATKPATFMIEAWDEQLDARTKHHEVETSMQLHRCWQLILEIYHLVPNQIHSGNQTWQWNMYEHVLFRSDFPIETSIGDFVLPPLIPAGYCYMVPVLSDLCLPDPSPSPTPTAPFPCHPQEQMCLLHVVDIYIWIIWVCATWNPSLNPQGSSIVMRVIRCLEQPFGFIPKPGLSRFSIFPKPPKSQRKPHDSSKLQLIRCRVTNKDVVSVTKGRLAVMGQMGQSMAT